jgi:glycosyltransferase involved in cell wall biosynthesis
MNKDNILVYREKLLLPSEGFIKTHYISFDKLNPFFLTNHSGWDITKLGFNFLSVKNSLLQKTNFRLFGKISKDLQFKIDNLNPKLIHAHFGKNGAIILPFAKKLSLPLFVTFHGGDATKFVHLKKSKFRIYNRRRHDLIKYSKKFICVSEFIAKKLLEQGFPDEKIIVNYIGINPKDNNFLKKENIKDKPLVFVGRLVEKKGINILIKSIDSLNKGGYPNLKINIIGSGPLENQLKKQTNNPNISFLGWKSKNEIENILENSSALIVPSHEASNGDSEGLPTVILEGINNEIPIITTYHGGAAEIIENHKTGFITFENDHIALAKSIIEFLKRENIEDLVMNAKKKLNQNFNAKKQSYKLQNIFQENI